MRKAACDPHVDPSGLHYRQNSAVRSGVSITLGKSPSSRLSVNDGELRAPTMINS
jgi:hypothetical protein